MKKIFFTLLISILLIFLVVAIMYKPNKKKTIKLAEVTHSIFYTPLYVAIENGYFKDEGLDIDLILTPGADKVSAAVLSGDVQIGFAGAESAIYVYNQNEKDYLQIFSGLTKRDGQFILSKNNEKSFSLNDLKGKEILVGRKSGMPALNFLNALKKSNINPKDININYSVDFASLSSAFISTNADYVNLFEPNATTIEKEKYGYVVESIGKLSGEMPYTVFYAKKSYIKNNKDIINKFINAINKGLEYIKKHDNKDIAKVIKPQFEDINISDLEIIIKRYKDNDSWLDNNIISEQLLINLEELLIEYDLIDSYVDYNKLII